MKTENIKTFFYIILSLIALGGAVFGIERYFAKSQQVEKEVQRLEKHDKLFEERLEIGILDDRIYQQRQEVYRIRDLTSIERKERDLTEAEKEILKKKKGELEKWETKRDEKIRYYEELKNKD